MELDPKNEKALYRRGEAHLLRNEFSLALVDFRKVLQVNSFNRAARSQIAICQRKIQEHHERDKKIYANMFQRFAEHDAKVLHQPEGKVYSWQINSLMLPFYECSIRKWLILYLNKQCSWLYSTKLISFKKTNTAERT